MNKKKKILPILILLGLGGAYFIWLKVTGIAIPCMFRKVTGYLCPGCGVTGLLYHLIMLDFKEAYHANPFLFVTGPILAAELIYATYCSVKNRRLPRWNEGAVLVYGIALCVFGVLRNL